MDKRPIEIQYPMKPREEEPSDAPAHAPRIICHGQDAGGAEGRGEAIPR